MEHRSAIAVGIAVAYFLSLIATAVYRRGLFPAVLLRIRQTLLQSFAWLSGVVMGALAADPAPEAMGLAMALFVMLSYFWTDPFLNDPFDAAIDRLSNPERPLARGLISVRESLSLYTIWVGFPLAMSAVMGLAPLLIMVPVVLSSLLYNVPPVRLKRFLIPSQLFPGFWAAGAVSLGYFGQTATINPWFVRCVVAVFVTILLTAGYKDLKDEEADRQNGIRNLVTTLGHRRASRVMAPMTVLVFTLLPFLFRSPHVAVATSVLGLTGASLLWRFEPSARKKILPRMAILLGLLALALAYALATMDRT